MTEDVLNRPCVRIILRIGNVDVSLGTGTLVKGKDGFYVVTAHHCIYGDKNAYPNIQLHEIIVERQSTFNAPFDRIKVTEFTGSNFEDDWAVIKVSFEDDDGKHPEICATVGFKRDDQVHFTGFQAVNKDELRPFKSKVLNGISGSEFRITLVDQDTFKSGGDHAVGLSGSGAFLANGLRLVLIGVLKNVKGDDALNNDIKCCSMAEIGALIGLEFCETATIDSEGDHWASGRFDDIIVTDKRNLIDKVLDVIPNFSKIRMQRMARDLANGKSEMTSYILPRDMSAIKYRVFDKCRAILEDFVEQNTDTVLTTDQIDELIEKFTVCGFQIFEEKAKMFRYPKMDKDLMEKMILDLINECYLSFDEQGIYATK